MLSITVEYSGSSYIAYLTEDRSVWESGNTVHEALGKLVMLLAALNRNTFPVIVYGVRIEVVLESRMKLPLDIWIEGSIIQTVQEINVRSTDMAIGQLVRIRTNKNDNYFSGWVEAIGTEHVFLRFADNHGGWYHISDIIV